MSSPHPHPAETVASGERPKPIITTIPNGSSPRTGVVLWPNLEKVVPAEVLDKMTPEQLRAYDGKPDLFGYVAVLRGQDIHEIGISGWLPQEEASSPRIKLMTNLKFGNYFAGSIAAMKTYRGSPAHGSYGLRLIGQVEIPVEGRRERITTSGQINPRFPDRELMMDAAHVLGFPETMIHQFGAKLDADAANKARELTDQQPAFESHARAGASRP